MVPLGEGQGVLMQIETEHNIKHVPSKNMSQGLPGKAGERKRGLTESEISMANAETEDDEVSFLNKKSGVRSYSLNKHPKNF